MILNLPALAYALILILAANYEARARDAKALTPLLSLGLSQIDFLWRLLEALTRRLSPMDQPRFDGRNPVHRAAGLLLMAQMACSLPQMLMFRSGAPGFFAPEVGGILLSLAASMTLYLSLSALGTGWLLRRDLARVCHRLGLRMPTRSDWIAGLSLGILFYIGATLAATAFASSPPADQAGARALFDIVKGSFSAAFLLAILSGAGEEIFFRGALQPVFGIGLSSLLFVLVHPHYGLRPELLILFLVSVGFGLTRKRFSTSAAIICHACYNFAPFVAVRLLPA